MKIKELTSYIQELAPLELAESYDNVGLIIGDENIEVSSIVVCVDVTRAALQYAIDNGANMVVSHHPVLFNALRKLTVGDYQSELVMMAITNKINIYSSHTNMDKAVGGINDALADMLDGSDLRYLVPEDCGTVANIDEMMAYEFVNVIRQNIDCDLVLHGDYEDRLISRFAIISGAGGRDDKLPAICEAADVDIFISSELKHSVTVEFNDRNIIVAECNHYKSEKVFIDIIANLLAQHAIKVLKYV